MTDRLGRSVVPELKTSTASSSSPISTSATPATGAVEGSSRRFVIEIEHAARSVDNRTAPLRQPLRSPVT